MQKLQSSDHGFSRRRCQPVKLHDVVNPHGLQLQHCAGQLAPLHLWHAAVWQGQEVLLCAQPEAESWSHSASPTCTVVTTLSCLFLLKSCADFEVMWSLIYRDAVLPYCGLNPQPQWCPLGDPEATTKKRKVYTARRVSWEALNRPLGDTEA